MAKRIFEAYHPRPANKKRRRHDAEQHRKLRRVQVSDEVELSDH